ncbi:hypothetical protein CEXT_350701 [Caerostris extrusa]|uniref:Uncharacterized protein n=1 Tax=Caerostris extrusa TaxID=172846 RepID=A0AAV4P2V4_CAEEX|nr:hypothetical protein CEXT_350701 [Caerostris extrusa]
MNPEKEKNLVETTLSDSSFPCFYCWNEKRQERTKYVVPCLIQTSIVKVTRRETRFANLFPHCLPILDRENNKRRKKKDKRAFQI